MSDNAIKEMPVKKPRTLTDRMRLVFKGIVDPVAAFSNRIGLTPNTMTLIGLLGNTLGGVLIAYGHLTWGGLMVLIVTPFDAIDGAMARLRGEVSDFGAFVDAVSDRYAELIILGGMLIYFLDKNDHTSVIVTYAAAVGTVLVSYVKARADSLKFDANTGILTRMERYLVLAPLLVFNLPVLAVWLTAVLANFTALQRIWRVRRQAHARQLNKEK
jgi:CDP-diacylglycerol--glycerol-3-phosphate 3-phosphatidyltransferase